MASICAIWSSLFHDRISCRGRQELRAIPKRKPALISSRSYVPRMCSCDSWHWRIGFSVTNGVTEEYCFAPWQTFCGDQILFFYRSWAVPTAFLNRLCFLNTHSGQRNLKILSLLNADFGVTDILRLLGTVAKGSGEHLIFLDLRGAFREWQAPHDNPRYS